MQAIERLLARRARARGRLPPFGGLARGSVVHRPMRGRARTRRRVSPPAARCAGAVAPGVRAGGVRPAGAPAAGAAVPPREPPLLYTRREGTGMDLAEALLEVGPGRAEASFALFAQTPAPHGVDAALQATGA